MRYLGMILIVAGVLSTCGSDAAAPEANAGADYSLSVGETPVFDACASTGEIDQYVWTIVQPGPQMPDDEGKVINDLSECSFALGAEMALQEVGDWTIELTTRGPGGEDTDEVVLTVVE